MDPRAKNQPDDDRRDAASGPPDQPPTPTTRGHAHRPPTFDEPTVVAPRRDAGINQAGGTLPGDLLTGESWIERPDQHLGRLGRYTILRKIGEGGMGAVYEARQESPSRVVALKVIRPGMATPDLLRRFEQEAQALGRLQHPGIAQVFDAGLAAWEGGRATGPERSITPYLAMELVRGRPLLAYAAEQHLGVRARLSLLARIADAVHHAHQKGVIHRDLKPGNVLVVAEEAPPTMVTRQASASMGVGQPKVLDFGVARLTDVDRRATMARTDVGQLVGTLPYMSPEQVTGDPLDLDVRSDVYALGVMLYELLAGRLPYDLDRKGVAESVRVIREQEPQRLSTIDRALRGDVETIALKALEKDKARRYQSASELAADIRRHLADEPIVARPAGALYSAAKFARRHRALVSGAAVAVLALVGASVVSAGFAVREAAARARADASARQLTAVASFVEGMLAEADPAKAQGRDVTVREALDKASQRLDAGELRSEPSVELGVRETLGRTYLALGRLADASAQLDKAMALLPKIPAMSLSERVGLMQARASVWQSSGDLPKAEALFRDTLGIVEREHGGRSLEWASVANNLAIAVAMQGRIDEAEPLLRSSMLIAQRAGGPKSKLALDAMTNLATVLDMLARYDEAEPLSRKAMELRLELNGENHPDTLVAVNNYGVLLAKLGRLDEAEAAYRRTLDLSRRVLGADHPDTLMSIANLAGLLDDRDKPYQSRAMHEEALRERQRVLGVAHPETIDSMIQLGWTTTRTPTLPVAGTAVRLPGARVAELIFREAVARSEPGLERGAPEAIMALQGLGAALSAQGRCEEALAPLRRALGAAHGVFPEIHTNTCRIRAELGTCLLETGRAAEALPELVAAEACLVAVRGEGHVSVTKTRERIERARAILGREAESGARP